MPRGDNRECGWACAWIFTWNNPPESAKETIKAFNSCYTIAGFEHAPTTGTPHIQGYVKWDHQHSFEEVRQLIPQARWARAKGTPYENRVYCTKESTWFESGKLPLQGARKDIHDVREILQKGGTMNDVVNTTTSYQAARFGEIFLKYNSPLQRRTKPYVKWIWGPTGTGKSHMAFEEAKSPWISNKDLTWWDGYWGQKHVIIDDFRGNYCPFQELLRILDKYPYRVMIKGSSQELLATHIWITSCIPPEQAYPGCNERINQLTRRIDEVVHLTEPFIEEAVKRLAEELLEEPPKL